MPYNSSLPEQLPNQGETDVLETAFANTSPRWAENSPVGSERPNTVQPGPDTAVLTPGEDGWPYGGQPSRQIMNWWMHRVYQWLAWLYGAASGLNTQLETLWNHVNGHLDLASDILEGSQLPNSNQAYHNHSNGYVNASKINLDDGSEVIGHLPVDHQSPHDHTGNCSNAGQISLTSEIDTNTKLPVLNQAAHDHTGNCPNAGKISLISEIDTSTKLSVVNQAPHKHDGSSANAGKISLTGEIDTATKLPLANQATHYHNGQSPNPSQINLGDEVQGTLPVANLPAGSPGTYLKVKLVSGIGGTYLHPFNLYYVRLAGITVLQFFENVQLPSIAGTGDMALIPDSTDPHPKGACGTYHFDDIFPIPLINDLIVPCVVCAGGGFVSGQMRFAVTYIDGAEHCTWISFSVGKANYGGSGSANMIVHYDQAGFVTGDFIPAQSVVFLT